MKIPRRLEQCEGCKALFVCTCSVEMKLSEARMQRDELKSRFASETIPSVKDIIRKSFDEISSNIFIYTTEKSRLNSLEYSRKKKALKTSATDAEESSSASLSKNFLPTMENESAVIADSGDSSSSSSSSSSSTFSSAAMKRSYIKLIITDAPALKNENAQLKLELLQIKNLVQEQSEMITNLIKSQSELIKTQSETLKSQSDMMSKIQFSSTTTSTSTTTTPSTVEHRNRKRKREETEKEDDISSQGTVLI
jgi:hypothetical protein